MQLCRWWVLQVCFLCLTTASSCSFLWNPIWTQCIALCFNRQCLLAGTNAVFTIILCSTSGRVGGDKVISAPLRHILPSLLALERCRYIYSVFRYRPVSPSIFPFFILISASLAETDIHDELVETSDIAAFPTSIRKAGIYCIPCVYRSLEIEKMSVILCQSYNLVIYKWAFEFLAVVVCCLWDRNTSGVRKFV